MFSSIFEDIIPFDRFSNCQNIRTDVVNTIIVKENMKH